jgi:hypothetical protein
MKERPILLNGPMVRAILDGSKTQTRRVAKEFNEMPNMDKLLARFPNQEGCPYGAPGDRLWVRETCRAECLAGGKCGVRYIADDTFAEPNQNMTQWESWADEEAWHRLHGYRGGNGLPVPSIHMPRWACRIVLEVVSVRVERLQCITATDAVAEGVNVPRCGCEACSMTSAICPADQSSHIESFAQLWDSIYGTWDANPWVWVVEFRRVDDNESEATK